MGGTFDNIDDPEWEDTPWFEEGWVMAKKRKKNKKKAKPYGYPKAY